MSPLTRPATFTQRGEGGVPPCRPPPSPLRGRRCSPGPLWTCRQVRDLPAGFRPPSARPRTAARAARRRGLLSRRVLRPPSGWPEAERYQPGAKEEAATASHLARAREAQRAARGGCPAPTAPPARRLRLRRSETPRSAPRAPAGRKRSPDWRGSAVTLVRFR